METNNANGKDTTYMPPRGEGNILAFLNAVRAQCGFGATLRKQEQSVDFVLSRNETSYMGQRPLLLEFQLFRS
jgi:hypothetical protein